MQDRVTSLIAAYNAHDAAAISRALGPAGKQEDVPFGRVNTTPEDIIANLSPFFLAVPDAHWQEEHRIVAGKSVVVLYRLSGHLQRDLGPFKASGQFFICPGIFVVNFADADRVAAQDFWDPEAFGRQIS